MDDVEEERLRTYRNGDRKWFHHGKLHRENGPAVVYPDGTQKWYRNSDLHRMDGPAVIWYNGHVEYWIFGYKVS